jgi:hypothetical protein
MYFPLFELTSGSVSTISVLVRGVPFGITFPFLQINFLGRSLLPAITNSVPQIPPLHPFLSLMHLQRRLRILEGL